MHICVCVCVCECVCVCVCVCVWYLTVRWVEILCVTCSLMRKGAIWIRTSDWEYLPHHLHTHKNTHTHTPTHKLLTRWYTPHPVNSVIAGLFLLSGFFSQLYLGTEPLNKKQTSLCICLVILSCCKMTKPGNDWWKLFPAGMGISSLEAAQLLSVWYFVWGVHQPADSSLKTSFNFSPSDIDS